MACSGPCWWMMEVVITKDGFGNGIPPTPKEANMRKSAMASLGLLAPRPTGGSNQSLYLVTSICRIGQSAREITIGNDRNRPTINNDEEKKVIVASKKMCGHIHIARQSMRRSYFHGLCTSHRCGNVFFLMVSRFNGKS